jgi:hypothetical protein
VNRRRQISEWLYRMRWGHWCDHYRAVFEPTAGLMLGGYTLWTKWRIVDGARKMRYCRNCGRTEFV